MGGRHEGNSPGRSRWSARLGRTLLDVRVHSAPHASTQVSVWHVRGQRDRLPAGGRSRGAGGKARFDFDGGPHLPAHGHTRRVHHLFRVWRGNHPPASPWRLSRGVELRGIQRRLRPGGAVAYLLFHSVEEIEQSFTAKDTKDAKEQRNFTAKDAKDAEE